MTRAGLALLVATLSTAPAATAGVFLSAQNDTPFQPASITHAPGFDGSGGQYTVKVCLNPLASTVAPIVEDALAVWNNLQPVPENCIDCETVDKPPKQPRSPILGDALDLKGTLIHELGHCTMGLAHPNEEFQGAATSFTTTLSNLAWEEGTDGARGSSDDSPRPLPGSRLVHWYRKADNDPFKIDATVIDTSTYTRLIADLPGNPAMTWAVNANAQVGSLSNQYPNAQSVMYTTATTGSQIVGLAADEASTVRLAQAGLDSVAGTADDYTVELVYSSLDCSDADVEIRWQPILSGAIGSCASTQVQLPADTTGIHKVQSPGALFDKLVITINSDSRWDIIFADGFESGSPIQWEKVTQ